MKQNARVNKQKFTIGMKKKLVVLFVIVLLAFVGLGVRLILITKNNGEEYEKQVLSQQQYDSTTIPFRRGEIKDANGTTLAYSEKVYNVILDAKLLLRNEKYVDPTVNALVKYFKLDGGAIRNYLSEHPTSQYYTLAKKIEYDQVAPFQDLMTPGTDTYDENIQGVWFEDNYIRKYPNGTLACDVLGFTTGDNIGTYGLEEYYNDTLSGTLGREFGYLDEDSTLERTTIPATDGDSIVTTIDGNLQTIVEKYIKQYNDEHVDNARKGNGANNIGCIMMDVHTGDILAMASYPNFDPNDPRDTSKLIGMPAVDEKGKLIRESDLDSGVYITQEMLDEMPDEQLYQNYNALWRNFCITDTYEPGSVAKPFTVATALETGSITGEEVYNCTGKLDIGGWEIHCHNTYGDGMVSVERGITISCNVAMMHVAQATGVSNFTKFQKSFGFGLKSNVDLAGEARTENTVIKPEEMTPTDLATNAFGQNFDCDMIEMIAAFSSLINGGYYYEPHMVKKIVSSSGSTIKNIEPRILRQTISPSTSEKIIKYCNTVVSNTEEGTGKTARPAGYMIGGKTGTAQTRPRGNRQYVVSFMGYAPADHPDIAIYVVVDRPNVPMQDDAKNATWIVKRVLTEALPYLNYPMTEEISEKEQAELDELRANMVTPSTPNGQEDQAEGENAEGEKAEGENAENTAEEGKTEEKKEDTDKQKNDKKEEKKDDSNIWEKFDVDEATGYYIDPNTHNLVNPENGNEIGGDVLPDFEGEPKANEASEGKSSE